jgi:hypothetical protein
MQRYSSTSVDLSCHFQVLEGQMHETVWFAPESKSRVVGRVSLCSGATHYSWASGDLCLLRSDASRTRTERSQRTGLLDAAQLVEQQDGQLIIQSYILMMEDFLAPPSSHWRYFEIAMPGLLLVSVVTKNRTPRATQTGGSICTVLTLCTLSHDNG